MSDNLQQNFERLLRDYGHALRRLAWAYTRDPVQGDDLLQEIALALWTALPRFRGDSSERTWLYRVAHNTACGFLAGQRRLQQREAVLDLALDPPSPADTEAAAIQHQRRELLASLIAELNLTDRQLIVLHLEGLSATEIESASGLSAGNVATRLTRIRQRFAAAIRERNFPA